MKCLLFYSLVMEVLMNNNNFTEGDIVPKLLKFTLPVLVAISGVCLLCCSLREKTNNSKKETSKYEEELPTADRSKLTERQKKILQEEGLPTELNKLTQSQKIYIAVIEDALLYLDKQYEGVSFDFHTLRPASIMGKQELRFIPTGFDKEDKRNFVTVVKERDGSGYSDNYMLILVRESMENVIKSYMEDYFSKGDVKIYLRPGSTEIEYGDVINETTVIGKVQSRAAVFLPSDICPEDKFNTFIDDCLKWTNDNDIQCGYRFTTVERENYEKISQCNYTEFYYSRYIVNDASK